MLKETEYRPNVSAVILSSKYPEKCEFFIAHRSDIKNAWQFPQGGIDDGETPKEALFRELKEEIGYNDIEIIAEFPEWISYEFPNVISKKMYPFKGQRQKYFLVRLKEDIYIDLNTHTTPEFEEYEFVAYQDLFKKVTFFKRNIYRKVIDYFRKEGFI
ncbi:Adenosine (5')-pentaphospho-(5'')-adenosine pyrophosphohydrolase [hydrothermal vent metagenome]|uniref:Adenosine (5')-pentaphospho-(5'')-adenosine pyrophosphohydrolase n=1 Tax=hydrothermal vent metagenome TaxID=652676 RepID=A0A1W1BW36_9ZZZZ